MKTTRLASIVLALAACALLVGCAGRNKGTGETDGDTVPADEVNKDDDWGNKDKDPSANPNDDDDLDETDVEGDIARIERELRPVFFAFDRADLTSDSRDTLTANARVVRENPGFDIWIEGHCDERGTNEYNLALGDRRARAARDFLVSSGLESSRFTIVSYGEERPFANGHDESSWSQNRRAHFKARRAVR